MPSELTVICGGTPGAFIVNNQPKVLKAAFASIPVLLKGSKYSRARQPLLACMQGYSPQVAVGFGREVLNSTERPTYVELEGLLKGKK